MRETYTLKQAMERLGLKHSKTFHHLECKYPEAFVIVKEGASQSKQPRYDKAVLDRFIERREQFKQENP